MSTLQTPHQSTLHRRDEWLNSTCRSFSETTGWMLQFTPATEIGDVEQESQQLDWCWHCELTDGNRPTGVVHLTPPEDINPLVSFESAYQLAELLAENINRFLHPFHHNLFHYRLHSIHIDSFLSDNKYPHLLNFHPQQHYDELYHLGYRQG